MSELTPKLGLLLTVPEGKIVLLSTYAFRSPGQ